METLVKPLYSTASLCRTCLPRVLRLCWRVAGSCCHLVLLTPSSGTQMSQARHLFFWPLSLTRLILKYFWVPLIEKIIKHFVRNSVVIKGWEAQQYLSFAFILQCTVLCTCTNTGPYLEDYLFCFSQCLNKISLRLMGVQLSRIQLELGL